jgi:hypothetical protein
MKSPSNDFSTARQIRLPSRANPGSVRAGRYGTAVAGASPWARAPRQCAPLGGGGPGARPARPVHAARTAARRCRPGVMAAAPEPGPAPRRGGAPAPEQIPVAFVNAAGLRLAGTLTRADPAPGARAAILCHGYAGTQDDMRLPEIAQVGAAGVAAAAHMTAPPPGPGASLTSPSARPAGARQGGRQRAAL